MNGGEVRQLRDGQVNEVWAGTMEVEPTRNATVRTAFPIAGIIHGQRPGLYLVTAENAAIPPFPAVPCPETEQAWPPTKRWRRTG